MKNNNVKNHESICSRCGRSYSCPPATSRVDNKTPICPECGTGEAFHMTLEQQESCFKELAAQCPIYVRPVKGEPSPGPLYLTNQTNR